MDIKTKKILNCILFFASKEKNNTIDKLKLIKLIWLSDRIHLNKYGRLILKDQYFALPHGPIPTKTLDITNNPVDNYFSTSGKNGVKLKSLSEPDVRYFSKSDLEVMKMVWEQFGEMGMFEIRDFSHEFPEWLRFKNNIENRSLPNKYEMYMNDFFDMPADLNYQKLVSDEEIENSKAIYESHNAIQTFLN